MTCWHELQTDGWLPMTEVRLFTVNLKIAMEGQLFCVVEIDISSSSFHTGLVFFVRKSWQVTTWKFAQQWWHTICSVTVISMQFKSRFCLPCPIFSWILHTSKSYDHGTQHTYVDRIRPSANILLELHTHHLSTVKISKLVFITLMMEITEIWISCPQNAVLSTLVDSHNFCTFIYKVLEISVKLLPVIISSLDKKTNGKKFIFFMRLCNKDLYFFLLVFYCMQSWFKFWHVSQQYVQPGSTPFPYQKGTLRKTHFY